MATIGCQKINVSLCCLMTTLPLSLDDLVDHVRQRHLQASALDRVRDAVDVASQLNELGDQMVGEFVDEARNNGASWAAIGAHLGLTRQAVQKRYAPGGDVPSSPLFSRMEPDCKQAIMDAQDAARQRQAGHIGTEHLLLGIASEPKSVGAKALNESGASPKTLIAAINGRIGIPSGPPTNDELPFTVAAKSTLKRSLRESLRLGANHVGTEHLVLSILTAREGIAIEVLHNLGISYDSVRSAVLNNAD